MPRTRYGLASNEIKNLHNAYRKFGKKYRNALIARAKQGKNELLPGEMGEQLLKIAGSETKAIELSKLSHYEITHLAYDLLKVINRGKRPVYVASRPNVNKLLSKLNYRDVRHLFGEFYANEIESMAQFSPKTIHNLLVRLPVSEMLFILKKLPGKTIEKLGRAGSEDAKLTVEKIKKRYPREFQAIDAAVRNRGGHSDPVRLHWLINKSRQF